MQKRVTIKEVAADARVSITTVSHVLNSVAGKRVNPETRARVIDSAQRLGYQPNALARSLRSQRSNSIALIGDEIATTPFAGQIVQGVQDIAWAHDAIVLVVSTGYVPDVEHREVEELLRRQVDGVLYAAMYHRPINLPPQLAGVPTVVVNATCEDAGVPWVTPDEVAGGRDAAGLLLAAGHRNLGFINTVDDIPAAASREQVFREAIAAAGLPQQALRVVTAESEPYGGQVAARELFTAKDAPTAVFCFSDRVAMGAYNAAAQLGLRIPNDVSIVGFDNQDYVADGLYPGLTTIQLPHYEMGTWASDRLFELINAGQARSDHPIHARLRGPVVYRDSVAPPSRG